MLAEECLIRVKHMKSCASKQLSEHAVRLITELQTHVRHILPALHNVFTTLRGRQKKE